MCMPTLSSVRNIYPLPVSADYRGDAMKKVRPGHSCPGSPLESCGMVGVFWPVLSVWQSVWWWLVPKERHFFNSDYHFRKICTSSFQSVVFGPATSASPGNFLEMPHPICRPLESETLMVGLCHLCLQDPGIPYAYTSLRTTDLHAPKPGQPKVLLNGQNWD